MCLITLALRSTSRRLSLRLVVGGVGGTNKSFIFGGGAHGGPVPPRMVLYRSSFGRLMACWLWTGRTRRSGELLPSRIVLIGKRVAPGIFDGLPLTVPFVEMDDPITELDMTDADIGFLLIVAVGVLLLDGGAPLMVPALLWL